MTRRVPLACLVLVGVLDSGYLLARAARALSCVHWSCALRHRFERRASHQPCNSSYLSRGLLVSAGWSVILETVCRPNKETDIHRWRP